MRTIGPILAVLLLGACDDGGGDDDYPMLPDASAAVTDAGPADAYVPSPLLEARPYDLLVPASYDPATPTPLVLLLHGYTATGAQQALYFGLPGAAERHGFLLATPDGTIDSNGNHFWNATDYCCDFGGTGVDDVAYLTALLDDVVARYNVDPKRVFVIGHSNGGFMSHRMACDRADRIAAIISLAGLQFVNPASCAPTDQVNVLQVHGNNDQTVPYNGGTGVPSATVTVATWAQKNGCTGALTPGDPVDVDTGLAGAETTVQTTADCPAGGAAELWTIVGGGHVPSLAQPGWSDQVWAWFEAHPKP